MGGLKKQPKSDDGKVIKIVKSQFSQFFILLFVVVAVIGFQFQLAYLKNRP